VAEPSARRDAVQQSPHKPADLGRLAPRRGYLDWMRGVAVLMMIEAHLLDSWTGGVDRSTRTFGWSLFVGGLGTPLFLYLAGLTVALSAGSKSRRIGDARAASAVVRRGLEIFGLAFLFRIQAWILGWSSPRALLKVDILNIMGPSIAAVAALWGVMRTTRARYVAFTLAMLAMTLLTPLIRAAQWLAPVPDPIEAYLRPVRPLTSFTFFPWAGFVFAGAIVGLMLDGAHTRREESRANLLFGLAGATLAAAAWGASYLPSPYPHSDFWTSSPSFFFLRTGLLTAAVALAYAWQLRPAGQEKWSPLNQLGRSSLFVYWIHVEMVYGLISLQLHKALTLQQAWLAFAAFAGFMVICAILKDRVVEWWRTRRRGVLVHDQVNN
jgi:uncharacterized membrane protein